MPSGALSMAQRDFLPGFRAGGIMREQSPHLARSQACSADTAEAGSCSSPLFFILAILEEA